MRGKIPIFGANRIGVLPADRQHHATHRDQTGEQRYLGETHTRMIIDTMAHSQFEPMAMSWEVLISKLFTATAVFHLLVYLTFQPRGAAKVFRAFGGLLKRKGEDLNAPALKAKSGPGTAMPFISVVQA